ncbi:MAG: BamA/TamA family outer membrane protein [Alphaproteobacteria bacterium]|nr:BamA/TamA family outer membrane protein [Alphaproteobacteria bacterium]
MSRSRPAWVPRCVLLLAGALACAPVARGQEPDVADVPDALPATEDPPLEPIDMPGGETWYVGLPVSQVTLEAPQGGLPRENLEPLLRVRQGEIFDRGAVRQDIALLLRAGAFAAVEAHAEPWITFGPDGEPVPAVQLAYRVWPSPRIDHIDLETPRGAVRRTASEALDLGRGEAFFPARDRAPAERRVQEALVAAGWPDAVVSLDVVDDGPGQLDLVLTVDPGPPRTLARVSVSPTLPLAAKEVRRQLRHEVGLRPGRRISDVAARDARQAVTGLLAAKGFLDPRVNLLFSPEGGEGAEVLAVLGEAGARTEVVAIGRGAPAPQRLPEILGLTSGTRLTEGMVEEAESELRRWFQARGRYQVEVRSRVERADEDALLILEVDRGPLHRVRRTEVEGAEVFDGDTLARALREAAPDSLGRRVVVDEALPSASRAIEEVYRGAGRLSADATLEVERQGKARWRPPFKRVVPLTLRLTVDEGAATTLTSLWADGLQDAQAGGGAMARVELAREQLVGGPYLPGSIDTLRQDLLRGLRGQGYLSADVQVETRVSDGRADVRMQVQPGQQVRLRSVLIQGNRRTRRAVIARELAVELGQPVTVDALEETRRRLYDLDLFRVVTLELVGEDDRARDLIVRVEERAPVLFEVGGGIATDRGILARGRLAHRNIGGLGHRASLLGQAGYAWSGDSWSLDTLSPEWSAGVRYEAPNLPARGQRLVLEGILREETQAPTWRLAESGFSAGVQVRLGEGSDAYLAYAGRWRQLEDIDPGALVGGDPWLDVLGMAGPRDDVPTLLSDHRFVSGPELTVILDRRDDAIDPRVGWKGRGKLSVWDGLAGGPATVRAEARLDDLLPLGPLTLASSLQGGVGFAGGTDATLGVEDRFTLGGSGSLRGFQPDVVGPANRVRRSLQGLPDELEPLVRGTALADAPTHWTSTGGDAMLALSLELRTPLSTLGLGDLDDIWLVTFTDAGRVGFLAPVADTTSQSSGLDPLFRYSVGGGIRLATPVGPTALVVGVNPHRLTERDEPAAIVHFTLGEL